MSLENVYADDNSEVEVNESTVIALPKTISALMENRKTKTKRTLHDQVEQIYMSLWEDEEFQKFLDAVYPSMAVEGDLKLDDGEAARMIRQAAKESGNGYVASQNLATLIKSLNVVMRRFGISRSERREG